MEYATGDAQKRTCRARITTEGNDLKQQTAGDSERHEKKSQGRNHNSASIYNDHLIHLSTVTVPTFTTMKSSLYRSHLVVNFS